VSAQDKSPDDRSAPPEDDQTNPCQSEVRAEGFQAVRDAHRSEIIEDYVELIAELIEEAGEARPVDIATRMGVTQPTVAKNLARMKREGFIRRERYRSIFLTDAGQALAEECRRRHRIVLRFLISLGLDAETAEHDAEGIEHHVSDKTLALFENFVKSHHGGR
jgi:DtxR family manganese transport transcriptional regulator